MDNIKILAVYSSGSSGQVHFFIGYSIPCCVLLHILANVEAHSGNPCIQKNYILAYTIFCRNENVCNAILNSLFHASLDVICLVKHIYAE